MRKIASLFVAAALVSTVSVSAMAADINEAEQAVLNELNGSVVMKGQKLVISEEYKNQAKNYFNTIDMTQEQSDNIVAELKRAEQLITEQGKGDAGNIPEMLYAKKRELLAMGQNMVSQVGLTMSWNAATKEIVIADADSTVLFQGKPILVTVETPTETPTGTQGGGSTTPTGTSGGTTGGNTSGGTTSGGTTSGGTTGKIADGSAVKTTGAGVDTSAVAGASAVAVLAAAAFAKEVHYDTPSLPVTEIPNDRSWKQCFDVGTYGTVCGIIYIETSELTIGGRVTWDDVTVFDYEFAANQICATEDDLLKLIELIPALAEFKPVIDEVLEALGKIPAKVFNLCLGIHDISWQGTTLSACARIDLTLICWLGKCAWQGSQELGCFTI